MTIGFVERVMYLRGMRALNLYFFFWENLEIISFQIFTPKRHQPLQFVICRYRSITLSLFIFYWNKKFVGKIV